jgi:tight adherence protein B
MPNLKRPQVAWIGERLDHCRAVNPAADADGACDRWRPYGEGGSGDRVCETVRVAREVGGSDLGTVLRTLSELLRSDARTRAELETRQGWIVNAARLAVAAPWLVLLLLGTQSTPLPAYDSAGGTVFLAVGAAVCVVVYRVMLRIGRLPDDRRVLQ